MNLRDTLNNLIANRFKIEADPANSVGLINLKQIYEVSVDGQTFEVVLNQADILNNVDGQSPNGQNYMRLLMYRIFERFNAIQSSLNPGYRSPVVLNNANVVNSRGLFVERPNLPVFLNQPQVQSPILSENPLGEIDSVGRSAQVIQPEADLQPTQVVNPPESFTGFSSLPLSLKVLQRGDLIIPQNEDLSNLLPPTLSAGLTNAQGQPVQTAIDGLVNGQIPSGDENLRIASEDNMFLNFNQFTYAFYLLDQGGPGQPGEPASLHNVTILSRRTDFSTVKDPTNEQVQSNFNPNFVFSFFENHMKFDRVYVNSDYLLAGLEAEVLRHVRYCHSKLIIYNTIRFVTFERKLWGGLNETICQKSPLKPIGSKEITFRAAVAGTNPKMDVNVTANLMFTSSFESSLTTFYRANRFITCSAFTDSQQISDPAMLQTWEGLELALGKTIVLHDTPGVSLQACFLRGPIIECSEIVQLRGLVSNAGTVGPNGISP